MKVKFTNNCNKFTSLIWFTVYKLLPMGDTMGFVTAFNHTKPKSLFGQ